MQPEVLPPVTDNMVLDAISYSNVKKNTHMCFSTQEELLVRLGSFRIQTAKSISCAIDLWKTTETITEKQYSSAHLDLPHQN